MGQYYKAAILAENKKTVKEWVYSHDFDNGLKLMEHSWMKNSFVSAFESLIKDNPQRVVWAGDYADDCKGLKSNFFARCVDKKKVIPSEKPKINETRYVINHSTKEFVDKTKVKADSNGWQIHPLPLLTCEGNGRGGGDFRGDDKIIGWWCRDIVSVSNKKPKDYKEVLFNLTE